jgi:hypothetical protein
MFAYRDVATAAIGVSERPGAYIICGTGWSFLEE